MTDTFKIFFVDFDEAKKIEASANEPHNHSFEELIIGIEGQLEHFIDFATTKFDAPFISFVTKGKVHRVRPVVSAGKCRMWAIRFKSEFIPETIFQLYSLYHENANLLLKPGDCFNRLVLICEMMHAETQQPEPDFSVIRHLLSTLFTMIESERQKQQSVDPATMKTKSASFIKFLKYSRRISVVPAVWSFMQKNFSCHPAT